MSRGGMEAVVGATKGPEWKFSIFEISPMATLVHLFAEVKDKGAGKGLGFQHSGLLLCLGWGKRE